MRSDLAGRDRRILPAERDAAVHHGVGLPAGVLPTHDQQSGPDPGDRRGTIRPAGATRPRQGSHPVKRPRGWQSERRRNVFG